MILRFGFFCLGVALVLVLVFVEGVCSELGKMWGQCG